MTPQVAAKRPRFALDVPPGIAGFLHVPTPAKWLENASSRLPELLNDHANCELKAASTALATIFRYPDEARLSVRMSRLAREEMRHFEQISALLARRGIPRLRIAPARYAGRLRKAVEPAEPARLRDTLICGAYIEARSCERFAALLPLLDDEMAGFYASLLSSEARHFEHYLSLARDAASDNERFALRVQELGVLEARLITEPDSRFAFHSGPVSAAADGLGGSVTA